MSPKKKHIQKIVQHQKDDEAAGKAMVERGRRYVETHLSFGPVAAQHVDVYRSVIA